MMIDARSLPTGTVLKTRYCVIGSGMGGSSVATELAAARRDVLIVEAGNLSRDAGTASAVAAEHVGRSFNLPLTRCIELGGTSNQWHGMCARLDAIDFQKRPWVNESGWPLTLSDLSPFYRQAARLLGVPDEVEFDTGDLGTQLCDRRNDLRFNRSVLQEKLIPFRKPPFRWKDTLVKLARSGALRCVVNATALELLIAENGSIEALLLGTSEDRLKVRADMYIVCAGGLETPRLLLNSRRNTHRGIGNGRDLVGRYLMDHPVGHFCKIRFNSPTRAPLYASLMIRPTCGVTAGLALTAEQQEQHRIPNSYAWLRPSVSARRLDDELLLSFLSARTAKDLTLRQLVGVLTNRDILYRVLVQRFGLHPTYHFGDVFFMTEQLPNRNSRVKLSDQLSDEHGYPIASVDWRVSDRDLQGFSDYTKLLFDLGLKSDQHSLARQDDPSVWERTLASAAHHMGTARMADHPDRGVVDRNLRVFDTPNLYICDASVFVTAGGVNPSLTISALGLRLAHHLSEHDEHTSRIDVVARNCDEAGAS